MLQNTQTPLKINRKNAWVNAEFGALKLIFPQTDVNTIETRAGITPNPQNDLQTGWVMVQNESVPIYCLADNMAPQTTLSNAIRFVLILKSKQGLYALACERIKPFTVHTPIEIHPIPDCMHNGNSPVAHITLIENELAYITHADDLFSYIHRPGNTQEYIHEHHQYEC